MIDLLLSFIPGGSLTAIAAAILAGLAGFFGIYRSGHKAGQDKQKAREADKYEQHLEDIAAGHDARNHVDPSRLPNDDPYRRD